MAELVNEGQVDSPLVVGWPHGNAHHVRIQSGGAAHPGKLPKPDIAVRVFVRQVDEHAILRRIRHVRLIEEFVQAQLWHGVRSEFLEVELDLRQVLFAAPLEHVRRRSHRVQDNAGQTRFRQRRPVKVAQVLEEALVELDVQTAEELAASQLPKSWAGNGA